eukprot:7229528-Alexandrium_andersonii.AAC.1
MAGKRKREGASASVADGAAGAPRMPAHSPDFNKLISSNIPKVVLEICLRMLLMPELHLEVPIDVAELFAGCGSITRGMRMQKLIAIPYELKLLGDMMDLCSASGYALALGLVLRLASRGRGMLWLAPVCSSWVFISSGSTGRSKWSPEGDDAAGNVEYSNKMAARCALLCAVAHSLNVTFIVEQPSSSVMFYSIWFQWLIRQATERFPNCPHRTHTAPRSTYS